MDKKRKEFNTKDTKDHEGRDYTKEKDE